MNNLPKNNNSNMADDKDWEEPTWDGGDMDPHWDELFVSNSLFLMRNLQNDMKTNNFDAMIKRLSSLNPKQLDTFLQDYHSIDEEEIECKEKEPDLDKDEHEHEHEHEHYDEDEEDE
jgi:hypothetical protein